MKSNTPPGTTVSDQALSSCVLQHAGGSPTPNAAGQARWGRQLSAHHSSKLRMRSHTIRAMFSASLYVGSSTEYLCACPAPGSAPAMRALLSTLAPPVAGARHGWEAVSPSDAAVANSPALSAARAARVAALRRVISARLRARTTGPLPAAQAILLATTTACGRDADGSAPSTSRAGYTILCSQCHAAAAMAGALSPWER